MDSGFNGLNTMLSGSEISQTPIKTAMKYETRICVVDKDAFIFESDFLDIISLITEIFKTSDLLIGDSIQTGALRLQFIGSCWKRICGRLTRVLEFSAKTMPTKKEQ